MLTYTIKTQLTLEIIAVTQDDAEKFFKQKVVDRMTIAAIQESEKSTPLRVTKAMIATIGDNFDIRDNSTLGQPCAL